MTGEFPLEWGRVFTTEKNDGSSLGFDEKMRVVTQSAKAAKEELYAVKRYSCGLCPDVMTVVSTGTDKVSSLRVENRDHIRPRDGDFVVTITLKIQE